MSTPMLEAEPWQNGPSGQPNWDSHEPASCPPSLRWSVVVLMALGVLWRTARYLWQFPIWGDEAFICLNLLDRSYLELIQPLRFDQVAPLLFLWGQLSAYRLLGGTELALRLLPFLAGVASLALFWRWACLSLNSRAAVWAVGIMAVAYYPVRHSCEAKPYAFDLFVSLSLLVIAVSWLREPKHLTWFVVLTLLVPLALGLSYPAVFIAGAVSVALLPVVWRQPGWAVKALYLAYNLLMGSSFLGYYWLAGLGQHASMDKTYWVRWFPPAEPRALAAWLFQVHTGNMLAYPVGGHGGGSTVTFLLCLVGAWQFWRIRRWDLLTLTVMPFGLTMIAAALHKYPYGGSARVAQHLAPAICLLAGTGVAALLSWTHSATARRRQTLAAYCLLAVVGVGGLVRDVVKPYKTDDDRFVRQCVTNLLRQAAADDDPVVIMDPISRMGPTFEWYLRQERGRVSWSGQVNWERPSPKTGQLSCVYFDKKHATHDRRALRPGPAQRPMVLAEHSEQELRLGVAEGRPQYCAVYRWLCPPESDGLHSGRESCVAPTVP